MRQSEKDLPACYNLTVPESALSIGDRDLEIKTVSHLSLFSSKEFLDFL